MLETKEEVEKLERALAEREGSASLGDLRREAALDPQVVLALVRDWPERFGTEEGRDRVHGHATLIIKLVEPEPHEKSFLIAVRGAGKTGIGSNRLWQKRQVTSVESAALALKHEEVIRIERRQKKIFYFWRDRAAEASSEQRQSALEGLLQLIGDGARHMSWLARTYPDAPKIIGAHPELFVCESVNLGPTPATEDILVRLREKAPGEPNGENISQDPRAILREVDAPQPEQSGGAAAPITAEMKWHPACREMSRVRRHSRGGKGFDRERHPLPGVLS